MVIDLLPCPQGGGGNWLENSFFHYDYYVRLIKCIIKCTFSGAVCELWFGFHGNLESIYL